ncbi:MAG: hypothetical protein U0744_00755 [Gemmataceae bacterium]
MTSPRGRLLLFTVLFLAWLGWLGYLVSKTRDTIVLSRPQLLVSSHVAVLRIEEKEGKPSPEATLVESLKAAQNAELPKSLNVRDLPNIDATSGWRGPGEYLVPLTVLTEAKTIRVTPIPMSPGFVPRGESDIRIYPATPDVLRQFKSLGE